MMTLKRLLHSSPAAVLARALRLGEQSERGIAAVEMAILLPVLVLLLAGALDFGRSMHAYVAVSSAAHEAAVYAGRFYVPTSSVTAAALADVLASESRGMLAVPTNTTVSGPTIATNTAKVPMVQVRVTYTFQPWTFIPFTGTVPITVTASAPMPGQVL